MANLPACPLRRRRGARKDRAEAGGDCDPSPGGKPRPASQCGGVVASVCPYGRLRMSVRPVRRLPAPVLRRRRTQGRPGFRSEAKSKAGVGRPLHPYHAYHAVSLVTLDGNIQNPIARRPAGKRAKVRYGLCRHRYAVFNLDLRFPRAAAETSSHFVKGLGRVSHRPFQLPSPTD